MPEAFSDEAEQGGKRIQFAIDFVYVNTFESTAQSMDRISDFAVGVDKLDLSGLRAAGLSWSGSVAALNSVWATQSGGDTYVRANVDGSTSFVPRGRFTFGAEP